MMPVDIPSERALFDAAMVSVEMKLRWQALAGGGSSSVVCPVACCLWGLFYVHLLDSCRTGHTHKSRYHT